MPTRIEAPLLPSFRSSLRGLLNALIAACLGMLLVLPLSASAQQVPAEAYGPYNAVFLADGPGLTKPSAGPYRQPPPPSSAIATDVLDAQARSTLAFWFRPVAHSETSTGEG